MRDETGEVITFQRTHDYALVGEIMRHEALYDKCADDFEPAREDFRPREDEAIWYVLVYDDAELLGLFALAPQNAICWEIHTRLLPHAWGPRSLVALKKVIEWVWRATPALRLVTTVPAYNRLALSFGRRAGFEQYGVNPQSWQRDGKLHDQVLLGISKQ